ncbi:hypothetical protein KC318_g1711 [Hortaea werneckii]|nr:hypothetical protein KC334_g461 [Hortaea werneckii]KAI7027034.1 hypothetical protein KC355_g467 [Hortaea werneckii]KAI7204888.1 hypothetical protein KC324_g566 [Hortaea werneckii]KAI7370062.1 hypothetical protein KC354_g1514 [Hortaea werneckii]KAI7595532.1 hypothetical protein KC316_g481 [Hortaea werneckii]
MPTTVELLQAEVDEETESQFRLLIDKKTVKCITVAAGVYDTDDMCFGPQLVQILPEFPPGDWKTGQVDTRSSLQSSISQPSQSLHASIGKPQRMIAKRPSTNGSKDATYGQSFLVIWWKKEGSSDFYPEKPYVTLDFESDVAGFPSFVVADLTEAVEIEVKYAEQFMALSNPESDGPWTFSNGLSNSFRVERFSLTKSGPVRSFFVQGAQRWMTIDLLSKSGVTFAKVGFEATSAHNPASELPAQLNTSNPTYDSIWGLGARAAGSFALTPATLLSHGKSSLKGHSYVDKPQHSPSKV